ncbi:MAG: hypothetical protein ACFFFC_14045 [Candidatus Thorarchaeota archaeon]
MSGVEEKERVISIKCCIPRKMSSCTDDELRLSIVTLKNAIMNITVCMNRIERELKKRGTSISVFKAIREKPIPEIIELAAFGGQM